MTRGSMFSRFLEFDPLSLCFFFSLFSGLLDHCLSGLVTESCCYRLPKQFSHLPGQCLLVLSAVAGSEAFLTPAKETSGSRFSLLLCQTPMFVVGLPSGGKRMGLNVSGGNGLDI